MGGHPIAGRTRPEHSHSETHAEGITMLGHSVTNEVLEDILTEWLDSDSPSVAMAGTSHQPSGIRAPASTTSPGQGKLFAAAIDTDQSPAKDLRRRWPKRLRA